MKGRPTAKKHQKHSQECLLSTNVSGLRKGRSTLFNYCQAIREDTWSDSQVEGTKRFGGGEFVLPKRSKCQQARGKCHVCVCVYVFKSTWKERAHWVCGSQSKWLLDLNTAEFKGQVDSLCIPLLSYPQAAETEEPDLLQY